ncbi:hypothetical protein K2X89_11005 [Myxococcota bacterium]|nr:hypothetical protein [Myxococcota bacterium]
MDETREPASRPCEGMRGRVGRRPARSRCRPRLTPLALVVALGLASCERTATKADYVDARVAAECAERSGESFTLCRLEVIKRYMKVPLDEMQAQFPAPQPDDRMGCS